jgi:hypothetical protein
MEDLLGAKTDGWMKRAGYVPSPNRGVDDQAVAALLLADADATLVELQTALKKRSGLQVSTQHLWRVDLPPFSAR